MNLKLTLIGGVVFYAVTWLCSMVTGPVIHQGVLAEVYKSTAAFWRPELMLEPPDMAALMPRWITTGLVLSFIVAALYGIVRPALAGHGWQRGAKYGFGVGLLANACMATMSGVLNLPDVIWVWWTIEGLFVYVIGGAVLGWLADRWFTAPAAR